MFHSMFEGMGQDKCQRESVCGTEVWQFHVPVLFEFFRDSQQLVAGYRGDIDQDINSRPQGLAAHLVFMLPPLRPQHKGLLSANNMDQHLAYGSRSLQLAGVLWLLVPKYNTGNWEEVI
jgi:hypothetical protein